MVTHETLIIEVDIFESVEASSIKIHSWKDSKLISTKTIRGKDTIALYASIKSWKEKYGER